MSFKRDLSRARSHIIFVLGLAFASIVIMSLELADLPGDEASDYSWGVAQPLSSAEREAAAYAWSVVRRDAQLERKQRGMAKSLGVVSTAPPAQLTPEAASVFLERLTRQKRARAKD
jgi:hypothetical protein